MRENYSQGLVAEGLAVIYYLIETFRHDINRFFGHFVKTLLCRLFFPFLQRRYGY